MQTLGERFADVWHSPACPPELKKKIVRTVLDEIIVTHDDASDTLQFTLHWVGGTHTALEMPKPRSGVGQATALEDLELIRRMAGRYGDDEIARVLNKLGRRIGKGKRWSQERVATARRNHGIAGCKFSVNLRHLFSAGLRHLPGHCLRDGQSRSRREGECYQPWREARSSS